MGVKTISTTPDAAIAVFGRWRKDGFTHEDKNAFPAASTGQDGRIELYKFQENTSQIAVIDSFKPKLEGIKADSGTLVIPAVFLIRQLK